ncbi:hypothetical protein ACISU4_10460 [Streptomyces wuyuanensis]|uniref:hypothetical protein n=1 Tax=Streptomyces wuyuanensis TaxID=1196353 RepID=UPI00381F3547
MYRDRNDSTTKGPGITGEHEAGDNFGRKVAAVNTRPGAVGTARTVLPSIGVPGEGIGTVKDAGSVRVVPLIGSPGASEVVVEAGKAGLPGPDPSAGTDERAATSRWPPFGVCSRVPGPVRGPP